ncbi:MULTISPECIES: SDR family oxidoreductase [unclassified Rathayibacter]|uniref:SDR family oxidoreductase n=1 Tax=unclassified Rathayibacter TaxID=2609250 RepID=UPI0006FDA954|nr:MULTISPECIES: SDR family oxidoreductase [unclassified Rathayibacter]KQQ00036.1 short-chain dehydrogenase [Rathayibacter sp. Leaf294]KQS09490.1 short-chain dehydrogenase [Rathayibacter sp. Leaf185]
MALPDSRPVLWITGAGSGMGRAIAVSAARQGHRVALSGRRPELLRETAEAVEVVGGEFLIAPMDVASASDARSVHRDIEGAWGPVTRLVAAAGLNRPDRYWRDQSMAGFASVVETNLTGCARVVDAVLPGMREAGDGVIVLISSVSGWQFSPDAGVAYSASKTALSSLTRTLNAQEKRHGIRACCLCPGDVDTAFLAQRPVVPDDDARRSMLTPVDIAAATQFVLDSPSHVCIDELVITPVVRAGGEAA